MFRIKSIFACLIVMFIFGAPAPLLAEETGPPQLVVNLPSRTITLYAGGLPVKEYPVAIGKISTPTPLGDFSVISKEINPSWYPPERPGYVVPPGPANPLGRRWLGFIANNYGIHGTNDPGSIGQVVTNGCIRMRNADVEELFELVSYNTPVSITYDLVKVFANKSGQVKVSIYSDVYSRGKPTAAFVRNLLKKHGLSAFVSDACLAETLAENGAEPVDIIKTVQLRINDEPIAGQGVIVTGETAYVPLKAMIGAWETISSGEIGTDFADGVKDSAGDSADQAAKNVGGDKGQADFLLIGTKKVPIFITNNNVYMTGGEIENLLGGRQSWQENGNCWSFEKTAVFYNGKKTALETIRINGILAVPLKDLAAEVNRAGRWDETSRIFYLENEAANASVQIKPDMIGSEPFLGITKINEYFDTFVYWNMQNNTIEMTHS